MIDEMFVIANAIMCVGTLLLIRAVLKDRAALKGYTFFGAFLTVVPIGMFISCYIMMGNWMAAAFGSVTFLYWMLVTVFMFVRRNKNER